MDKAGVQKGDFLAAADGYPLNGAANSFLARAHFERGRPIELHVRRGEQRLALKLVIAAPVWQTLNGADYLPLSRFKLPASSCYCWRFLLVFVAPNSSALVLLP